MTTVTLKQPCSICGSMRWCGRQCASAPKLHTGNVSSLANAPVTHKIVTDSPVTHSVTHKSAPPEPLRRSKAAERQARYRAKLGDTYREGNRERMRQRRATGKAATAA